MSTPPSRSRQRTVILAGGGTGGHVFPLVAVAKAMRSLVPDVRPVFVGTSRGMETKFVPEQGFDLELLDVLPMRGAGFGGLVRGAARALRLLPDSRVLLSKHEPLGVLSVGGYAAGPISLAARLAGLPVALLEPNSVPGLANLLIAPFVDRAYTAFEMAESHFAPGVVRPLGVPLRPGFQPVPYSLSGPVRVLVLGGSQGAKSLNETLPVALGRLAQSSSKVSLDVIHQCGAAHVDAVTKLYSECTGTASLGLSVQVTPFIDDMPQALGRAHLVVGRAGAGAVSEILAVGRPSLLVPYPFASGDHQRFNAESLQRDGAAICVTNSDATVDRMTSELEAIVSDPPRLMRMAEAARRVGRPRAAESIARDFLQLVGLEEAKKSAPPTGGEQAAYSAYEEVA